MAKIKKYTIEEKIPDRAVFLRTQDNNYNEPLVWYFLVEEEEEVEPTHILLKCPHCSRDYQSKI